VIRTAALVLSLAGFACAAPITEPRVEHAGSVFRIVRAAPDAVQLVWKDEKG
jgi:hypothetical protein